MANKVSKPIGVRKLTWFPLDANSDTETVAASYQSPEYLSRLIQITTTPVFAEGSLESDDGLEEDVALMIAIDVEIEASQLTDVIRASLLGHSIDQGGGVVVKGSDEAPFGALAWEELLSGSGVAKYKKVVLYKGRFREMTETARTTEKAGITYQTHKLTGRFYRRMYDGALKYSMREDTASANATKLAAWFAAPQEYGDAFGTTTATPTADPVAGAVTAGSTVELACATSGATIRYTKDGTTPNSTSTLYDGPILINEALTIKAKAFKAGLNDSEVLSAAYTIQA